MAGNNTHTVNSKSAVPQQSADAAPASPDVKDQLENGTDDASVEDVNGTVDNGDDLAGEPVGRTPSSTRDRPDRRLSISISARNLAYAALLAALVGSLATFVWLYVDARRELDAQALKSDNDAHAEKVALDYAVNAATMNFQDLGGWKTKLVAGTSPELNDKLTKAAESMQQILVPLQWTSSAIPLVAKVRSDTGGTYVVDCFVNVQTKTVQASDALQSTATYSLTLDSNKNWQITDVGGIGAVVGRK